MACRQGARSCFVVVQVSEANRRTGACLKSNLGKKAF